MKLLYSIHKFVEIFCVHRCTQILRCYFLRKIAHGEVSAMTRQNGITFWQPKRLQYSNRPYPKFHLPFRWQIIYVSHIAAVYFFVGFHCCHLFRKGVSNLYSLLQPGGQALLTFPINRNFQKTFKAVSIREPWAEHFKASSISSICYK